jgi:hypothetical protein
MNGKPFMRPGRFSGSRLNLLHLRDSGMFPQMFFYTLEHPKE